MKLVHSDFSALGNFNPSILQPDWLVRQGLIPDGALIDMRFDLGSRAVDFRAPPLMWRTTRERFTVSLTGDTGEKATDIEAPGAFAASIFEILSHTPIMGVGHNFHFEIGADSSVALKALEAAAHLLSHSFADPGQAAVGTMRVQYRGLRPQALVTLDMAEPTPDGRVRLMMNVHYSIIELSRAIEIARDARAVYEWVLAGFERMVNHGPAEGVTP
ncbi:MAG: hypothetical protein RLP09_30080 [Sandaracinaceae bacterium]